MKKWLIPMLIIGIIFLFASLFVYAVWIGTCYPASLPAMSAEETLQFRQDCNLDTSRVEAFAGFLVLFLPGIFFVTTYWLVRPPQTNIQRSGPLASFLLLTLFDSLLLVMLALLSYPETGTGGSAQVVLILAALGLTGYVSLLGIWQWKRWGLLLFQGVAVFLTVYSGMNGLSLIIACIAIFSVIYLTLMLRPLRVRMD
jgi:hypothetical protein